MTSLSIGPLIIPLGLLPWIAAFTGAWLTAMLRRRKQGRTDIEPLLWWALLAGLVVARAGFVVQYHGSFADAWWTVLDIRDRGFWWPGGIIGALLVLALAPGFRDPEQQRERAVISAAGVGFAVPVLIAITALLPGSFPLPEIELQTTDGELVNLREFSNDNVSVINIWASWCPHCHRSMPILEQAQSDYPSVRFILVNQGETASTVNQYFDEHGFEFDHLLLDPLARLANAIGSRGVPTTLIIDAENNIINVHTGGLSAARLEALLGHL